MDRIGLRFGSHRSHHHHGTAWRSVRSAALLQRGFCHFLDRLRPVRRITDRRPTDFFPRRPSARRLDDRRQRPRHRLSESAARGTGPRPRSHLDGVSHRLSHRAFPRRLFDRQHRLALDFLPQLAVQPLRRLPRMESRPGNPDHGKSQHRRARRCAAAPDQRTIHLCHRSIAARRVAPSDIPLHLLAFDHSPAASSAHRSRKPKPRS